MSHINVQDQILVNAPVSKVWEAIQNPIKHAGWHPSVMHIAGEHKLGEVRRCDVTVGNKPGYTEERCSVFEEGRKIMWDIEKDSTGFSQMVSGWMAGFSLEPKGAATLVTAQSTFQSKNFLFGLMMPMITHRFHQTQQGILIGLKKYVEG